MGIYDKLLKIQSVLKAPKGQYNSYGNYNYRSCEDILESLKPLLQENECTVLIHDELMQVSDRIYIKATIKLIDCADGTSIENTAYAREALSKKGMDECQITGTASSYARKYALNGMFLIDDAKDPDTNEYKNQTDHKSDPEVDEIKIDLLRKKAAEKMVPLTQIYEKFGLVSLADMKTSQFKICMDMLEATR